MRVRCTEVSPGRVDLRDGAGRSGPSSPRCTRRLTVFWFCCWMIVFWNDERGLEERSDWMRPAAWSGRFWGPAASRARSAGELLPLPMDPDMARWNRWGRDVLREGDIVFRLGDARAMRGIFALSWFIARATDSPFSHTGIVAIEDGCPWSTTARRTAIRLMPFEVWMLDCVGPMGVKRLKPEHRRHIPGVIGYCRDDLRAAGAIRLRVPPGRFRALLPRDDREGVPIPGVDTLRAGPDRRLGASDQLSHHRTLDASRHAAGAGRARSPSSSPSTCPGTITRECGPRHCWSRSSARSRRGTVERLRDSRAASACGGMSS